ncbi:MAG: hypothetical protein ACPGUF_08020, partial [Litorivicinus sp.]
MGLIGSLRWRALPIVIALALLPWLGWQALTSLSALGRDSQVQSLQVLADQLARTLVNESERLQPPTTTDGPLVRSIGFALQIDGFLEEWPGDARVFQGPAFDLFAVQHEARLYLAVESKHGGAETWSLALGQPGDDTQIRIQTSERSTQGQVRGVIARQLDIARWDLPAGYRIEFSVPLGLVPPARLLRIQSTTDTARVALNWQDTRLLSIASGLASDRLRVVVRSADGRPLADAGQAMGDVVVTQAVVVAGRRLGTIELSATPSPFIASTLKQIDALVIQLALAVLVIVV